ncbi:ATP-dependent 6-phosphofructokinase 1-like [Ylistrum balloti]|uniref:ATP-dependent 6-phosphofructokinase 1-like n=1 Tax=Ylistrum balloti TaxID=509963 RepID=UPI002905AB6C|nr:ATP-dependent 6-phosphofructokinase 1-like [Ylistrum balloti]
MTQNDPITIGVLTSGGDAPGMNAAIRAVVRTASYAGYQITGIRNGYNGIFDQEFQPLTTRSVSNILQQGGTFLGTGRCQQFLTPEGRQEAAAILKKQNINTLIVIGGNGSYRGAAALHHETGLRIVGIPASIDNDVGGTDFSIGFDTAVNTALDAIDRIRDTAFSLARVFFVEVMGRQSGQLAAAIGLASGAEAVIVPERHTDVQHLTDLIDTGFDVGKKVAIIVVAEGNETGGATNLATQVTQSARHDLKVRVVILGHIQRGGSPTASDRLLASRLGVYAIQTLKESQLSYVVGLTQGVETATPLTNINQQEPKLNTGAMRALLERPLPWRQIAKQIETAGVRSFSIIFLTGLFSGMVLALQGALTLEKFGAKSLIGNAITTSLLKELGPVLAALMVAGRVGAGYASELGTMVVTEQISALRALGLIQPLKGSIHVLGERIDGRKERALYPIRKDIGMVFQHGALFDSETVEANVGFRLTRTPNIDHNIIEHEVQEKLSFVDLPEYRNRFPGELSGGQKKRVAIARAMVGNPTIMLYDEPTTGLDPITARKVLTVIKRIKEELGTTSLVVTHELHYAYYIADRVILIRDGSIFFDGTTQAFRQSKDPYIVDFRSLETT